jgi:hypothetical protein
MVAGFDRYEKRVFILGTMPAKTQMLLERKGFKGYRRTTQSLFVL